MSEPEHARMMLDAAQKDLRAIEGMADERVFAIEVFGFHAQQALEKAIKAWLSLVGLAYPKTHDLAQLIAMLEDHGETVPALIHPLARLTDFAVQFRYETFDGLGQAVDRPGTIREVRALLEHVEQRFTDATT